MPPTPQGHQNSRLPSPNPAQPYAAEAIAQPVAVADPRIRSTIYKLFSMVFQYPTAEIFECYRSGDFLTALWEQLTALPYARAIVEAEAAFPALARQELDGISPLDLAVTFNQTFEVGAPSPPCPPYEGIYRQGMERTTLLIEVAEFYKQFGLGMGSDEGKRELPDHLRAELEFLHFLTFKEAQAREENSPDLLKGYLHAQKDFLARHMTWVPAFADKLHDAATLSLFIGTGKVLTRFVTAELAYVDTLFDEYNCTT